MYISPVSALSQSRLMLHTQPTLLSPAPRAPVVVIDIKRPIGAPLVDPTFCFVWARAQTFLFWLSVRVPSEKL
jgi:hypothetical protein